jgi:protease-4
MVKFLIGLITGVLLVFLGFVFLVFVLVQFREKPPRIAENSVLVLRLEGNIPEKPPLEMPFFLGAGGPGMTVAQVWMTLQKAAADSHIKAIVLEPEGLSTGWAKLEEIRTGLERFRKSGKPVYAFLRAPSTRDYYVALAADRIYLGPQEPLMLKGLRAERPSRNSASASMWSTPASIKTTETCSPAAT